MQQPILHLCFLYDFGWHRDDTHAEALLDMKRKSGQDRPAKRNKSAEAACDEIVVREGDGVTRVDIPPSQSVVFSGAASLEVTSGCVKVHGCLITAETGPVRLTAPSKYSKALTLKAVPAQAQAPLAQPSAPVQVWLHVDSHIAAAAAGPATGFTVVDGNSNDLAVWQVPEQWTWAANTLSGAAVAAGAGDVPEPVVVAVTGSKGSGKSSVARFLVNSFLNTCTEVAFLDLDPGQPELTPPGLLSLHLIHQPLFGPPHMQQQQPLMSCFLGDVSSQSDPGRYLQAVQSLSAKYYSMAVAAAAQGGQVPPPLVVNTPGWITGLGLELLAETLRFANPTHVLNMQLPNSKKNLPEGCWWIDSSSCDAVAPAVLQLPSVAADNSATTATGGPAAGSCLSGHSGETGATNNTSSSKAGRALSAVESRALSWLAWSQRAVKNSSGGGSNGPGAETASDSAAAAALDDFAVAAAGLAAAVPFEVSLTDVKVRFLHAEVTQSEIALAINGTVVGLAKSSSDPQQQQQQQGSVAVSEVQDCLGLGLVRAVDAKKGLLFVITDVHEKQLEHVNTLLVGRLEFPDKLCVTPTFASPYQGLYCLTSTATGAGVIKSRNNLLRTSLLRA